MKAGEGEQETGVGTTAGGSHGGRAQPLPRVRVMVGPAIGQPGTFKHVAGKLQSVSRVLVGDIVNRVITRWIIIAVLQEVDAMTQAGEAHDELQMMPSQATQRPAHHVAEHDNTELVHSPEVPRSETGSVLDRSELRERAKFDSQCHDSRSNTAVAQSPHFSCTFPSIHRLEILPRAWMTRQFR